MNKGCLCTSDERSRKLHKATDSMEGLSRVLVSYGGETGDEVDWTAVEAAYGTAFPEDYTRFVQWFGNGTIEGAIGVMIPVVTDDRTTRRVSRLPERALADSAFRRWSDPDLEGKVSLDEILVWGETDSADTLGWITTGADPDEWPVAVYHRGDAAWVVHHCGMAEFLVKLIRGEFPECPISDASLVGAQGLRFLHDREEERLAGLGVYPWAGD
ncbi:hypothetical protein [Streptomyces sp. NPDC090029]|uniref:hypothetical protein n=1 Tax=Streptomyces sp. NPDC090029 TaxID=3365924 RepID=UPI00382347C0